MKTYSINKARAHFSKLIDRAIAGEPQRLTRYGKEAVVIVSEREWQARGALRAQPRRPARPLCLGRLGKDITDRPWRERELGIDVK